MNQNRIRIAVIGCGAVTEKLYLPALRRLEQFEVAALVDKNTERVRAPAADFPGATTADNYEDVLGRVDAAALALPNHLHAPAAVACLARKVPVFVEKPMAVTVQDCDAMIAAAQKYGTPLFVGLPRRFFREYQFVKEVIDSGILGRIERFDLREGSVFKWPLASDYAFRKSGGGGLLLDTGSHTLDLLLWWLGDFKSVDYYDDAFGGVEADCRLELEMQSGSRGTVELSRTRRLRNTFRVIGEKGEIEVGNNWFAPPVRLRLHGERWLEGAVRPVPGWEREYVDIFANQLEAFGATVRDGVQPAVDGAEGRRAVALIEHCYQNRRNWDMPWVTAAASPAARQEAGA